ncbi:Protein arginine N-methyltransferase 9 [Frankliniella fusca]|uniref:Protein arginine N-methyltransferase 9 n=1 Tax=Frankliniella fusca TaxID=407009 RepID=A0AAE1LLT5_9NEOP|nr:Protein arginine N-methyltransferase 9 [Frankliniella fusca]
MSSSMSMWLEILNQLPHGKKKKRYFKIFIANLIAVSEGLRTGFLNDRDPILSLEDSKALITVLKNKNLIKHTVNILNIGNRETLFVNIDILKEFVTPVPPNFGLVGVSESIPRILPYSSDFVVKLVALMVDCFENFHQSPAELFVQPTDEISGSTLIGLCLGYPIIYLFQSDLSLEELIQFELKANFKIPEISSVNLFSFTVPRCLEFEIVTKIDLWHNSLKSKISTSSFILDISIDKKLDDTEQSLDYFQKALQACPSLLPASRAIQSIYNKHVERWHFRMLNDCCRNDAYYHAIVHRIQEGYSSVLDVGSGTGLLSMFAAREGAKKIWACESNKFIFKMAQSILAANNVSQQIHLINKHSNSISIPLDIPEKVSMIITEVFDAGLVGEGVLPMLLHAWEHLLLPPSESSSKSTGSSKIANSVVLPYSATVWVAAVQCIDIARRYRLLPNVCLCDKDECEPLRISFGGTKLCKYCEAPHNFDCPDILYHPDEVSVASELSEPYTTEELENVAFGYEFLSEPVKVFEINFNNVDEVKSFCKGMTKNIPILFNSHGSLDAIASWFHLNLDNNGTIISTAPFREVGAYHSVCWHQAIFPILVPKKVRPGTEINLQAQIIKDVLKISCNGLTGGDVSPDPFLLVSNHIISFLNNKTWMKALNAAALDLLEEFSLESNLNKKVLDLSPFPLLGLRILKDFKSWTMVAKYETEMDVKYIQAVARCNSIDERRIQLVNSEVLDEKIVDESFTVICIDILDPSGELSELVVDKLPFLMDRLAENGAMVPHSLSIECQLVESDKLVSLSQVVSDESMQNLNITEFMNKFAVDYHLHVSRHGLQYKPMSNCFEVFQLRVDSVCERNIKEVSVTATDSGTVIGVLYWVNLVFRPGMQPVSTACQDSHCNQAALLFSLDVVSGKDVALKCNLWYGLLEIKPSNEVLRHQLSKFQTNSVWRTMSSTTNIN